MSLGAVKSELGSFSGFSSFTSVVVLATGGLIKESGFGFDVLAVLASAELLKSTTFTSAAKANAFDSYYLGGEGILNGMGIEFLCWVCSML